MDLHAMSHLSQPVMIQGDRKIFSEDIDLICTILKRSPSLSRHEIVYTLCETLEWLTSRLVARRSMPVPNSSIDYRMKGFSACRHCKRSTATQADTCTVRPLHRVHAAPRSQTWKHRWPRLGPVTLIPLGNKTDQSLWNEYVQRYHYLGCKKPFGYRQRYFIEGGSRRLG